MTFDVSITTVGMDKDVAIERFKDYILQIADEGGIVYAENFSKEVYQYWKFFFSIVEADGYVRNEWPITRAFKPALTDKGRVFYDCGGYSGQSEEKKKGNVLGFMKAITLESLKQVVSNIPVELVKQMFH